MEEFAAALGSDIVLPCDVAEDESIDSLFAELTKVWPKFDGFVHSIGFAPADQLDGDYVNAVTREGFKIAHDISAYSFVAMAKACRGMLNPGSALLTLSYRAQSVRFLTTTLWVWQSLSGSERALHGERDGSGRRARQRHLCGSNPYAGSFRH